MVTLKNFIDLNDWQKREIWQWRNSQQVSCYMKNKVISWEEHLEFIEGLKNDSTKLYFLVFLDQQPIGVIDFIDLKRGDSCEFGLYQNPYLKGYGVRLIEILMEYALRELAIKNLYACAFNENIKAINLYLKFGFILTKKDEIMSYFKYYRGGGGLNNSFISFPILQRKAS